MHRLRHHGVTPALQQQPAARRRARCAAAGEGGEEQPSPAQAALKERIRRAKEYKTASKAAPSAERPQPLPPRQDQPGGAQPDEYNSKLAAYGAQLAAGQQQALAAAMEGQQGPPAAPASPPDAGAAQPQAPPQPRKGPAVSPSLHARLKSAAAPQQDSFSQRRPDEGPLAGPTQEGQERRAAAVSGSGTVAASYLRQALGQGRSEAAELRPEAFTLMKDEEVKARGVEFITKEGGYNPLEPEGGGYQPKVATWGMFPRPDNISRAYGGGRTYRPGEALESAEAAQQRQERIAASVLEYRKRQGLFMEPEAEAAWRGRLAEASGLMAGGALGAAAAAFDALLAEVPPRSGLGGEVQLQRAICLDSLGRNAEAYKVYMMLERHPAVEVRKRAKRMIFGFRAAENLKADTMSYAVSARGSKDWDKYFNSMGGQWNSGYAQEYEAEDQTPATLAAVAVLALPLVLIAAVALARG